MRESVLHSQNTLPREPFVIVPPELMPAIERVYDPRDPWPVLRMTADTVLLRPAPDTHLPIRRLGIQHVPAVKELYSLWGTVPINETMVRSGVYCGAHDSGRLVAVAGTHAVSNRRKIGAVGGVFTHPEYRGRGLATATTGAVCCILEDMGIDLIVLNVREDNPQAIGAYRRLGFEIYTRFVEGPAHLRS